MVELLARQPAAMRHCPVLAAIKDTAVPQQEGQQLLAFASEILGGRLAGANQIAHRFMGGIWHPYRGQLTGAQ